VPSMLKIFVGNVNFTTTEEQIRGVFDPHIVVEEIVIVRDDAGRSKGYAFVLTREQEKARSALRQIGKPLVDGRRLYFKEAHGKKVPAAPAARGRPLRARRPCPPPSKSITIRRRH
jgi:RNA recognition motif-containing protein